MGVNILNAGNCHPDAWSLQEQSVSRDRGNPSGAVTQLQLSGYGPYNPLGRKGSEITLVSDHAGWTTSEVVAATRGTDGWTLEATDHRQALAVEGTAAPKVATTLLDATQRYFKAANHRGISKDRVVIHPSVATRNTFQVPQVKGDVWSSYKKFLSANGLTCAWVGDLLWVFPIGAYDLLDMRTVTSEWRMEERDSEPSSSIACYVHHRRETTSSDFRGWDVVYPPKKTFYPTSGKHMGGSDTEPAVLTVDAREVVTTTLEVSTELTGLVNPQCMDSVEVNKRPMQQSQVGIYTVVGADNRPIRSAMWRSFGGSLEVKIGDKPSTIDVTLRGADIPWLAPFRIAESDGKRDYPSLYIVGRGVEVDIEEVRLNTASTRGSEPVVIDNEAIVSLDQAYDAMHYLSEEVSGSRTTMVWNGSNPQKTRPEHSLIASDALKPETATGRTHQTFGRLAGRTFIGHDRNWLCTDATTSEAGVQMTLETADTIADLNARWGLPSTAESRMVGRTLAHISGDRPVEK